MWWRSWSWGLWLVTFMWQNSRGPHNIVGYGGGDRGVSSWWSRRPGKQRISVVSLWRSSRNREGRVYIPWHCFLWWLPLDSLNWKSKVKEAYRCSPVASEWWAGKASWGTELGGGGGKMWIVHLMGQMEDIKSRSHRLLITALWFLYYIHCIMKVPVKV